MFRGAGPERKPACDGAEHCFQRETVEDRTQDGKACADDGEGTFYEDPVGCWCYVIYHGIELGGLGR